MRTTICRLAHLAAITTALCGCGGGGGAPTSQDSGRAVIKITWPERTRLIPIACNSIKVTFSRAGVAFASQILPRPPQGVNQTTTTFNNLKTGNVTLTATAYPNSNATGTAQANGAVGVTILSGQTIDVGLTMATTIDHLEITPANPVLHPGDTLQLSQTSRDALGNVVMTTPSKITWTSAHTAQATVDTNGLLTAVSSGSSVITVKDTESGKTGTTTASISAGGPISFHAPVDYAAGGGHVSVADMDGDGRLDIAVTDVTGSVWVLYGHGDGTFDNAVSYPFGGSTECEMTVADVDGDGHLDFVVCDATGSRIAVLRNLGGRSFAAPVYYTVGTKPYGVAAADFNGDGKLDLAVSNDNSNDICVLLNNGDGTFGAATFYAAGSFPSHGIVALDLNGDGKVDIAVANYVSANVMIYWGDGTGSFTKGPTYAVRDQTSYVMVADFNKDGRPDMVVSNTFDNTVSVLLNNGSGTFSVSSPYPANTYPHVGSAVDLDNDGLPDVAIPNNGTNYFTVLRNTGGGVLAAPVTFTSNGTNVRYLASGDFNGDGRPDIVVSNFDQNTVSVFLNTTP